MRTSPTGMPLPANKGFTLFEILLVLGLMAAAVATMLLLWPRQEVACARTIVSALRLARSQAVFQQHTVALLIDVKARHLRLEGKTWAVPAAVSLGEHLDPAIIFYPDGRNSGALLTCRGSRSSLRLRLSALDGKVSIQRL